MVDSRLDLNFIKHEIFLAPKIVNRQSSIYNLKHVPSYGAFNP